jgi:hypothetical protein
MQNNTPLHKCHEGHQGDKNNSVAINLGSIN